MELELNQSEITWILNRVDESRTGRVLVPSYVINKYKKLTNTPDSRSVIKNKIIDLYSRG